MKKWWILFILFFALVTNVNGWESNALNLTQEKANLTFPQSSDELFWTNFNKSVIAYYPFDVDTERHTSTFNGWEIDKTGQEIFFLSSHAGCVDGCYSFNSSRENAITSNAVVPLQSPRFYNYSYKASSPTTHDTLSLCSLITLNSTGTQDNLVGYRDGGSWSGFNIGLLSSKFRVRMGDGGSGQTYENVGPSLEQNSTYWTCIYHNTTGGNTLYINGTAFPLNSDKRNLTLSGIVFAIGHNTTSNLHGSITDEVLLFNLSIENSKNVDTFMSDLYNGGAISLPKNGYQGNLTIYRNNTLNIPFNVPQNTYLTKFFFNLTGSNISTGNFPLNPTIDLNGTQVWSWTGNFSSYDNRTHNLANDVNPSLSTCPISNGNCTMFLTFDSGTNAQIEFSDVLLTNNAQYSITDSLSPTCSVSSGSISDSYAYTAGSSATDTITCTLDGYLTYTEVYNVSDGDKTITLTSSELFLNFTYYNNSLAKVAGYWTDGNQSQSFDDTFLNTNLSIFTDDYIKVYYSYDQSIFNYTQFYENKKENGINSGIKKNITIISDGNLNAAYLKVRDSNGNPIDDALIEFYYSLPDSTGEFKYAGQRFTGNDGTAGVTYFYVPDNAEISMSISANGYAPKTIVTNIQSDYYDISNPLNIDLVVQENNIHNYIFLNAPDMYNDTLGSFTFNVYNPLGGTITYSTDNGATWNSVTNGVFGNSMGVITPGTHIALQQTSFVLSIARNNVVMINRTIINEAEIFDDSRFTTPSEYDEGMLVKFSWIALILGTGLLGLFFNNPTDTEGAGSHGKTIFMIAAFLLPILFYPHYGYVTLVIMFYFFGSALRRYISE